jgi:hypothetical protein
MLMGILGFDVSLAPEMWGIVGTLFGFVLAYVSLYTQEKKNFPEILKLKEAKRSKLPLMNIVWGKGSRTSFEVLRKDKDGFFFEKNGKPYKVDGGRINVAPSNMECGVECYNYGIESVFPMSHRSAMAIANVKEYYQDPENGYPLLARLSNRKLLQVLLSSQEWLSANVKMFLDIPREEYEMAKQKTPEGVAAAKDIREKIEAFTDEYLRAQKDLKHLPIEPIGWCWHEMMESQTRQVFTGQLSKMYTKLTAKAEIDKGSKERTMMYIFGAVACMVGGAVAIYILSMVV